MKFITIVNLTFLDKTTSSIAGLHQKSNLTCHNRWSHEWLNEHVANIETVEAANYSMERIGLTDAN